MDSNKIRKDIFQAFATLVEEELESDIKISYIQTGEEIDCKKSMNPERLTEWNLSDD